MSPLHPLLLPTLALLALSTSALARGGGGLDYSQTFHGDGTYYGSGGWAGGHCTLRTPVPGQYAGMTPVAMNGAQYGSSCGACLEISGNGDGLGGSPITGTFRAYVADECAECKHGDVDLAKDGDGRWRVSWRFVRCPGGRVSYLFQGSHAWYVKIQPRGLKSPARRVKVGGVEARYTPDNFFVASGHFSDSMEVEVWTADGGHFTDRISGKSGEVYGNAMG